MAEEGFKYQLSSKVGDHMLNVRADTAEEFRAEIDALFGEGASLGMLAPFVISGTLNAPAPAPVVAPAPAPTPPAPVAAPGATETCPACGEGQLVTKQRRDGKGSFVGCNRFPKCSYIKQGK